MAAPGASIRAARRSFWAIALLVLLGAVIPLAVASRFGALGIPRSDDWSYLLTLFRWVDTGQLGFNGWVSMTLIGQLVLAAPIALGMGRNIVAVQMFTAFLGIAGLLAVVWLGRQMFTKAWWALLVAVVIAVGPLWGSLAPTFMTDVPAFTFEMLCLGAGIAALRRRPLSVPLYALSAGFGLIGVSIRQYALIPLLAITLTAIWLLVLERDWRRLRNILIIGGVAFAGSLALIGWWSRIPDTKSLQPVFPNARLVRAALIKDAGLLRLVGLLVSPVVLLAGPVRIMRRAWAASSALSMLVVAGAALWTASMYFVVESSAFVGNYLAADGVLSRAVLGGARPDVLPGHMFELLVVIGSVSGIVLLLATVPFVMSLWHRVRDRRFDAPDPIVSTLGLSVVGFCAAYTVAIVTGLPIYDRYALPLLPIAALLLLLSAQRATAAETASTVDAPQQPATPAPASSSPWVPASAWAFGALALLGLLGLAYTVDSASFDGTRWEVAKSVSREGFAPVEIGGGFEWLSYHRGYAPSHRWENAKIHNGERRRFPLPCVTVVINPGPKHGPVIASAQSSAITRSAVQIVAFRNRQPCVRGAAVNRGVPDKPNQSALKNGSASRVASQPPPAPAHG